MLQRWFIWNYIKNDVVPTKHSSEQKMSIWTTFLKGLGFLSFHCNMNKLRGYVSVFFFMFLMSSFYFYVNVIDYIFWFFYWLNEHFAFSEQGCMWRHRQLEGLRFTQVAKRLNSNIRFQWECCDRTHKTHLKWKRALWLTVQIDLTRNLRYIFTDCRKLKKRKANGSMQFTGTNEFAVIILC